MKSQLIKDFNLPSYVKGKTFAEASKAIEKKFSERNDVTAKETKQELMQRLAKAQEHVKMQEALKSNSQGVPDMMNGQVPEGFEGMGQNQMMYGGRQPVEMANTLQPGQVDIENNIKADLASGADIDAVGAGNDGGGITDNGVSFGNAGGIANQLIKSGNMMFGDTGIDTSGKAGLQQDVNGAGAAATGALSGAAAGASLGPWGAAAGAVVGGASGLIGAGRANKDINEANRNANILQSNKTRNDFAYGGYTDPTDPKKKKVEGPTDPTTPSYIGGPGQITAEELHRQGLFNMDIPFRNEREANAITGMYSQPGITATPNNITPKSAHYKAPSPTLGLRGNTEWEASKDLALSPSGNRPTVSAFDKLNNVLDNAEDYDYFNDPDQIMKGQNKVGTMRDYLASKENLGNPRPKNINNTEYVGPSATDRLATNTKAGKLEGKAYSPTKQFTGEVPNPQTNLSGVTDWLGDNYGGLLRTAPFLSNALQLKNLDKPKRETLDRLDSRYKTDYVDERALENRVQNEYSNTVRGLSNAANGSAGALRSNLLSAGANKAKAMSDAYLKADDINRKEDRAAQQFNSRNDIINLRQANREDDINAREEGAYDTQKSQLMSKLGQDLGNAGKEVTNRKQMAEMFGYTWDGKYVVDKEGKKKEWKEFQKELREYKKANKNG